MSTAGSAIWAPHRPRSPSCSSATHTRRRPGRPAGRPPPGRPARATRGGAGQEPVPEDRLRVAWTIREADPVGLRSAVKKVFRDRSLVHRRQWHKRENVVSYLPKREQGDWRRRASTSNRATARWWATATSRSFTKHWWELKIERKTPNKSLHSYRAKPETTSTSGFGINPGSDLLSHTVTRAVPSAVEGLTTVFGMGTGVTPLLSPPGNGRPSRRSATSVKERTQPTHTVALRDNPPSPKPCAKGGLNTLQTAVSPRTTSQCK